MSSEEIIFEGLCMYANLPPRPAQKAMEGDDTSYSVLVECSAERFAELKKAGIPALTQLKEFDGRTYLKLKATKIKHAKGGQVYEFDDILVVSPEGDVITDAIANGSRVRALASLEEIKGKIGKKVLRLKAVVVDDLIVYTPTSEASLKSLGITVKTSATAGTEQVAVQVTSQIQDDSIDKLFMK